MKRVNNFLEEMEEIIKKDFESNDSKHPDIHLKSYTTFNDNIDAYFDVRLFCGEYWLYEVTYMYLYNEFIVYAYKLEDNYSVKNK